MVRRQGIVLMEVGRDLARLLANLNASLNGSTLIHCHFECSGLLRCQLWVAFDSQLTKEFHVATVLKGRILPVPETRIHGTLLSACGPTRDPFPLGGRVPPPQGQSR